MNFIDLKQTPVDLTNCDREPIHIPGAILPHGVMLVVDPDTLLVLQVGGDTASLLGIGSGDLLGTSLATLFSPAQIDHLLTIVRLSPLVKPRHLLDPALRVFADRPLDASIHRNAAGLIFEFEVADTEDRFSVDPLAGVQDMLAGLEDASTLQAFCQKAVESVRRVLGYDRAMIYRFMPDGDGWVFAESREASLVAFLDLHYPASDIPVQARAMYVKSWLRLIPEIDYVAAPVMPALSPVTGEPLDMSQATLRDVSPIHREYLRNMGVNASMSISIIRDGKLWGLIVCHHNTPRRLPRHLRAMGELFGSMFSLQLEVRQRTEYFNVRLSNKAVLQTLMHELAGENDYAAGLMRQAPLLLSYIQGGGVSLLGDLQGGVAVRFSTEIRSMGTSPNEAQITALTDWLSDRMAEHGGIFVTDRLGELWPPAVDFAAIGAGLLAISISRKPCDFILWFRPELVASVTWAGDPTKPVEFGPQGDRLTPRKSFAAWTETVRGRSSPWTPPDSDAAFDLRLSLLEVVLRRIDAVTRERLRVFDRDQMLMAELDHRVKNTLANIQALVIQTKRSASSLNDFVENLDGRIRSMAKAHSLLTQSHWAGVSLAALAGDELDPYGRGGAEIVVEGPTVVLSPKSSLALSLAVHELATNAAKYGSLSRPGGRVSIRWAVADDGGLHVVWREAGGPVVQEPERRGFGTRLIEKALAMETRGRSKIRFEPDGVVCEITLPKAAIISVTDAAGPSAAAWTNIIEAAPTLPAVRPRMLVVEDSALVIMSLEECFDELGWDMVGPATTVADALVLALEDGIDAALLDINLNNEMSWPVASILAERGIPFVFATGYDARMVLPEALQNIPVISKPYNLKDVELRLRSVLSPTR